MVALTVPYSLGTLRFAVNTACSVAGNVRVFFVLSAEGFAVCTLRFAVGTVCFCASAMFPLTSARNYTVEFWW
jgi:hypothetical protein